jgi:hypothetical protein
MLVAAHTQQRSALLLSKIPSILPLAPARVGPYKNLTTGRVAVWQLCFPFQPPD